MKRKVGGWVLFGVGIFLVISSIYTGVAGTFEYGVGDIRILFEVATTAVPSAFCIWFGLRLVKSKPRLLESQINQ